MNSEDNLERALHLITLTIHRWGKDKLGYEPILALDFVEQFPRSGGFFKYMNGAGFPVKFMRIMKGSGTTVVFTSEQGEERTCVWRPAPPPLTVPAREIEASVRKAIEEHAPVHPWSLWVKAGDDGDFTALSVTATRIHIFLPSDWREEKISGLSRIVTEAGMIPVGDLGQGAQALSYQNNLDVQRLASMAAKIILDGYQIPPEMPVRITCTRDFSREDFERFFGI